MDASYLQHFLSDSARSAKRSEIRELLKLIARPEIISLAGGLPAPETFPVDELGELVPKILEEQGAAVLQYGATEGDVELRQELIRLVEADGMSGVGLENTLITSASQQGLDLVARVFLSPGDAVVCGLPSYLGALGAFTACGARLSGVPLDEHGMRPDLLEQRLVGLRREGVRPKFLYLVPDFQNPAGVTLPLDRRQELLAIARQFDLLVIEDSPYRQLRYTGESVPTMWSLDDEGRVISLFTFSKILFPGLRLGWVLADSEVIDRLVMAKQPVDLCTSPLGQVIAREYLKTGRLEAQIERTKTLYAEKRVVFLKALDENIDPAWGVRWTRPEGGLFLWMQLPPHLDGRKLLDRAIEEHVAFVAGAAFHCDGSGQNTLRLNFSFSGTEQLVEATKRLARAIERLMAEEPAELAQVATASGHPSLSEGDHALVHLPWNLAITEVVV